MPRNNHEPVEPVYRALGTSVHAAMSVFTRRDWRHQERVPQTGGVLFVANHISNFDPLAVGEYLIYSGRWPRFLGKQDLWHEPFVGWLAKNTGQIPIIRTTEGASGGLRHAVDALRAGQALVIYPEATITGDPLGWPMVARSGAARVALEARCPVVPVGQRGAEQVIPGKKMHFPRLLPPKTMRVECGEPIDLSDLYDAFSPDPGSDAAARERSHQAIVEAGARMIEAITQIVAGLRNEPAPSDHFDLRTNTRHPRPTPPDWLAR